MEGFVLDDIMEMDNHHSRSPRAKAAKRKWREIEAIKDRQRLERELMALDVCFDDSSDMPEL
jgi:hypothetical protein